MRITIDTEEKTILVHTDVSLAEINGFVNAMGEANYSLRDYRLVSGEKKSVVYRGNRSGKHPDIDD